MLPTKFRFIWPSCFRGEHLKKSANHKQELPMVAMFVNGTGQNEQSLESTFIDASYQVLLHLADEGFQRRRLKCEKLKDDERQSDGKRSHCLWQGELKSINVLQEIHRFNYNISIMHTRELHFSKQ